MFPLLQNTKLPVSRNYIKCCLLFLLLQNILPAVFSQTKEIDSLRRIFYTSDDNKKKLSALFLLCEAANSIHPDSLFVYYQEAYSLATKENTPNDILQINLYKVNYYLKKGRLDSAGNLIDNSLILLKPDDVDLKYRFLILKSNVLIRSNKQKESMNNSLQLLQAAEQTKDLLTQIRAKISTGWAYMELGQNRDALNWFFEAVKMEKNIAENKRQPFLYSNIAAVYNNLGKNDSAEYFVKQAVTVARAKNELSYLANAYFIYASITDELGKKTQTETLLREGLRIRELIGDPFYIVSDIFQIGIFYANNKEPDKGIALVREGITIAEKSNLTSKLPILYTALARNYKVAGNFSKYGETLDTLIALKDSLYEKNSAEALAEMQTKYELQKKENTIIQQQYNLTKKNYFIYSVVALLAGTLLFGYFFLQNRRKTQRLRIQALTTEQKRKTTQAVMQAEEEERKRIAADLHDSVAQKMVVAKLNLDALGNITELGEPQQKIFNNINSLLDESTGEVRKLSYSMMPQAFTRHGLTNSVKEMLEKICKTGLKINFSADGDFAAIKENTALMIYRIIQECVQNVLKHADATRIDISMIAENNEVDVTIEDNGKGFNMNEVAEESSGLKNIRSRIKYLNGKIDINSKRGSGTVVAFYVPLKQ